MKPKNLVILAAVVLAFGAYIFFFERHQPTSEEARLDANKVFVGLEPEDVTGLTVETADRRVRLEKAGDDWRLREPLDYPADGPTVDSTLSSLVGLSADRRLPAAEVDPAEYGLDDPAADATLILDDGSDIAFAVGDEMPLGSKRPVLLSGSDEIVLVPGWFMGDLGRDVDDWRSREVTDLRSDEVASIDIEAGEDAIRAVQAGGSWRLLSPVEDMADRDHVEGLVSDLGSLHIEEFLDADDVDLSALGLDVPEYSVMVVRSDGGEPLRLDLGATRQGAGGAEVACRRGDDDYFWAADRVRTRLSKAPVLWRSRKIADFDTWEVEELRLATPEDAVELEKVDFKWQFADDGSEADQPRVSDRLTALSETEATDYDLMAPMTAEIGTAEIFFGSEEDGDGREPITFTFFAPLEEGGRAMARVSGRATLMGVDFAEVNSIFANFDDLRPTPEIVEGQEPG